MTGTVFPDIMDSFHCFGPWKHILGTKCRATKSSRHFLLTVPVPVLPSSNFSLLLAQNWQHFSNLQPPSLILLFYQCWKRKSPKNGQYSILLPSNTHFPQRTVRLMWWKCANRFEKFYWYVSRFSKILLIVTTFFHLISWDCSSCLVLKRYHFDYQANQLIFKGLVCCHYKTQVGRQKRLQNC